MSSSQPFDKKFIQDLAKMLTDCDLSEIEIEHDKSKLRVVREIKQTIYAPAQQYYAPSMQSQIPSAPLAAGSAQQPEATPQPELGDPVKSPMVGTAYLAPDPESAPFIKVGDRISKGDTIMIVEAMKVMNNIPAPKSGVITAIKVTDKEPVEFDQILAIIAD